MADVVHSFGVTGSGSKFFYVEFEEVVMDSPIFIETEHLIQIIKGYAEID